MPESAQSFDLSAVLCRKPDARAIILGSAQYAGLSGTVRFYRTRRGVLVFTEVFGLPEEEDPCGKGVFAFHIHSGGQCSGDSADPFADALTHYNPEACPHPDHAGDLPPLFSNHGYAFQIVLTDRFTVGEIIGKTVIIHAGPDDFTTQPGGSAGSKIACGQIKAVSPSSRTCCTH